MQERELVTAMAQYVVSEFKAKEGVDLSLHPQAYSHILQACGEKTEELKRAGRANIVLPCIINVGSGYLHLDVMVFMKEIERRGGGKTGETRLL